MYPIFETCFSIYRKKFIRARDVARHSRWRASAYALHMLIYKRLMRWVAGARADATQFADFPIFVIGVPDRGNTCHVVLASYPASVLFVVVFAATYVWLYVSIVRFKSRRWLVIRKRRHS
jgi:hypothetical protein